MKFLYRWSFYIDEETEAGVSEPTWGHLVVKVEAGISFSLAMVTLKW